MMLSLYYSVLSILPVIFYIFLIYMTTPSTINPKLILRNFFGGILGVGILLSIFRIFPGIQDPISLNFVVFGSIDSLLIFSFLQIGLLEELCKYAGFRTTKKYNISPIDIMIYCGITALGFSFIENITYLIKADLDIIFIRSTLSMILHLSCGLIMGYFLALSKLKHKVSTPLDIIMLKFPKFRTRLYTFIGISCAMLIHGFYDFVNFVHDNSAQPFINTLMIITFAFILNLMLSRDIIKRMKENETLKED